MSAGKGALAMVELLLEAGVEVDAAGPDGKTALARGARPDRVDRDGRRAVDYAAAMGADRAAAALG